MKKYQIIYADPPWQYNDPKGNDPAMGGITYPTMSTGEICNIEIEQLKDSNCTLFLWVTMPMLPAGLYVMRSWGFDYVTCAFTWVKQNKNGVGIYSGLGHWTNGNAELCLLGRYGKPSRQSKSVKQICLSPLRRHSQKPPEIRDRIVQLMGDLPRIELFARQKVDGWDSVGFDTDGCDIRESLDKIITL